MPSPTDMAYLEYLLHRNVLFDLTDHDFMNVVSAQTLSLIACSDCDCTPEYERHLCHALKVRPGHADDRERFRPHRHFRHGGPLRLASTHLLGMSDNRAKRMFDDLVEEIEEAFQLKGPKALLLIPHFPCGKARVHGHITLAMVLEVYHTAANYAYRAFGNRAAIFHHLHIVKEDCMRTYGINVQHLEQHLSETFFA